MRAEAVVLVAVLDPDHTLLVVEPIGELDRLRRRAVADEDLAELELHELPVEVDVVVAAYDHERISARDEARKRHEHRSVVLGDAAQLGQRVLGTAPESVLQLPSAAREWVATRVPGSMRVEYVIRAEGGTTREVGASIRLAEYSREGIGHFFVFRDLAETRQSERIERLAAVSTMAAGFAHEVRNPLASVRMFGELLLAELDASGEHHDIVGRMLSQVNRIERLVRTSLRLARPERPRKGHHWPSVIVNATLEALVPRLRDMKGELDVRVEEGLPRVLCDDAQAVQILVILITNALDATQDPSGVLLRVGTRREPTDFDSPARRVVAFSVVDTGPGVPEHLRASIFHPFFTTKAQGTGLGLSIAQQIAHENGGRIELVPGDGGGSIFTLIVPTEVTE